MGVGSRITSKSNAIEQFYSYKSIYVLLYSNMLENRLNSRFPIPSHYLDTLECILYNKVGQVVEFYREDHQIKCRVFFQITQICHIITACFGTDFQSE